MAAPLDQIRSALLYTAGRPVMDGYPPPERKGRRKQGENNKKQQQQQNPLKYSVGVEAGGGIV